MWWFLQKWGSFLNVLGIRALLFGVLIILFPDEAHSPANFTPAMKGGTAVTRSTATATGEKRSSRVPYPT